MMKAGSTDYTASSGQKGLRDINMPHYNYWQAVLLSFYSERLYIDVLKRWRGMGLGYLLLMLLILTIPLSIQTITRFTTFINTDIVAPLKELPTLQFKNGLIQFDKAMPYIIRNAKGNPTVIIDTTGAYTDINSQQEPDLRLLVTETMFYFYIPPLPSQIRMMALTAPEGKPSVFEQPISPGQTGEISGEMLIKGAHISSILLMGQIFILPMLVMAFFSIYVGILFFFTFLGQVMASTIFKYPLGYCNTFRLMAVALTPQAALISFYFATDRGGSLVQFISMALFAGYFSFAVLANRRQSKKMARI